MPEARILLRNLTSSRESLYFGEFRISRVGLRFRELRDTLSFSDVNGDDWVLDKTYPALPLHGGTSDVAIDSDVEDILLLLRLFKPGDLSFVRQAIIPPNGPPSVRKPYRAMNDLNSQSNEALFQIEQVECDAWSDFAESLRSSDSWRADWFATARRFFLAGGAKPFNPFGDDVDRVVDYATALESTLVPEKGDHITQRIKLRGAALAAPESTERKHEYVLLLKKFYDARSRIVHGNRLDDKTRNWLYENSGEVERLVRRILAAAVLKLPAGEKERTTALARLYDPTDQDRADLAFEKFKAIRSPNIRKGTADRIAKLLPE
jgi:hypothetical protein